MLRVMPTGRTAPSLRAHRANLDARWMTVLAVAVLWIYLPPGLLAGKILYGSDAFTLHVRRLQFARDHLFGPAGTLPAWYPREFMGTPFWSNLQNFPLIPTRLPLLLVDPWAAHGVGVNIAAVLTAMFTFLYARRLGLGRLGASAAAWTFACNAYFASRIMAGHLPLLEAFPALPLLLWLVERYATAATRREFRLNLLVLGLAAGAVMLAGHPQVPAYAVAAALLYLPVRTCWRRAGLGAAAMFAGIACGSFVLFPMALLIGRSTRALPLDPPANDVYFEPWRFKAFVLPWADFRETYGFWDTGCYVGLLPLAALAFVAARCLITRRLPKGPWLFLALLGGMALLLALPRPWSGDGGLTIFRSPSRQLYLTLFSMAVALGVAFDAMMRARPRLSTGPARALGVAAVILLASHMADIRWNVTPFVSAADRPDDTDILRPLLDAVGDGRLAMDTGQVDPINRQIDDIGVFDSILLTRPYRALQALSDRAPRANTQLISGNELSPRALAWAGVRMVLTRRKDLALPLVEAGGSMQVYAVPNPLPRAGFVPDGGINFADDEAILRAFRSGAMPNPLLMFLEPGRAKPATTLGSPQNAPEGATVAYRRPHPDRIELTVRAPGPGYVRILESFDPGWSATVDGREAEILAADSFVQAVRVDTGAHEIQLTYRTPGVAEGAALSAAGALFLVVIVGLAPRVAAFSPPPC